MGEQDQQRPPRLPVPFQEKSRRMDGKWQQICTESCQQTLGLQRLSLTWSLELHIDFNGNVPSSIVGYGCDPPHPLSPKYCHFTSALCSCQNQAEGARQWRAKLFIRLFKCLNFFFFFEWSNYKTSDSSPNKLTLAPVPGRAEGQSSHWCNPWVEWEEAWPGRGWLNWLLWSSFALSCPCFHLLHVHRPQEQLMQSRHIHKP